jgi:hypothetical protein
LADIFLPEWKDRVVALVQTLVSNGLPPALFGTVSYDVLSLIPEFHVKTSTPFLREYFHGITDAYKSDQIQRVEWTILSHAISRGLITNSPEDFWEEFRLFHQDRDLLDRLGENLFEQIYFWVSEGIKLYGSEWMRQFAVEYSRIPDPAVKKSIRDWVAIGIESRARLMAKSGNDKEYIEFLDWLKETLED